MVDLDCVLSSTIFASLFRKISSTMSGWVKPVFTFCLNDNETCINERRDTLMQSKHVTWCAFIDKEFAF